MGMFDTVIIDNDVLPEEYHKVDWQTKSLENCLFVYHLTNDGLLLDEELVDFTGVLSIHGFKNFYTLKDFANQPFYCGDLILEHGKIKSFTIGIS